MKNFLSIVLLLCILQLHAQDGPTAGSALRSLSGVDMISGKVIDVLFRESKEYTLFHFWKSESDSCVKQFAALTDLVKQYDRKLTVYGFPYEYKQQIPTAKAMTTKYKLNWAHLLQYRHTNPEDANVIDVLRIDAFPTYMLLDKEGMILVRSNVLADVEVVLKRLE